MMMRRCVSVLPLAATLAAVALEAPGAAAAPSGPACPKVQARGVLHLDFNPAFVHVDRYDSGLGDPVDGLTISSFFNVARNPAGFPPVLYFERDLVARIPGVPTLDPASFDPATDLEILTDLGPGAPKTVWPNDAVRAPDGVFPFEALVVPQGFHTAPAPGRLTAIDLDDPMRTEYVIDQSTQSPSGFTFPGAPNNSPRFYHRALFLDMDGDGDLDIVTARSGFRVVPSVYPPFSELVYFRNPGAALAPGVEWQEVVLFGGPAAGFLGPDIHLEAHDFEGDGVPEIVATHFFSGQASIPGQPPPQNGKIVLYGAPAGGTWANVNAAFFQLPRVKTLSNDQGFPFDIQIVDLDLDGRHDILATNHQPDGCLPFTSSAVPGRVYALEQPASGDLFGDAWTLHILKDDIRPNPSVAPVSPPGRLAPGRAQAFWPHRALEGAQKPHIVVGGDEAGKVWILTASHPTRPGDWEYESAVVFDINEHYGPNTTQTPMQSPFGIKIGTIGGIGIRYDRDHEGGFTELFVPVFEAGDIHRFSFRPGPAHERVTCSADVPLACGAP